MMLLRYFICLTVICNGNPPNIHNNASAKLIVLTPALLAPLLSIVTLSGKPFELIALLKNARAAGSSRFSDSMKSTVWPSLSTAR